MKTKITFEQGCQMVYFQTKNPKFGYILEDLAMEDVCAFYGRLVYFTAILYILWPFGIFWYVVPRKIWQPCSRLGSHNSLLGVEAVLRDVQLFQTFFGTCIFFSNAHGNSAS
jgi:hypothetical protein